MDSCTIASNKWMTMKKHIVILLAFLMLLPLSLVQTSCDKESVNDFLNKLKLSNEDIVEGLKKALDIAADGASSLGSKLNGFLGNKLIALAMPDDLKPVLQLIDVSKELPFVGDQLSGGLKSVTDNFVVTLNRAAEASAGKAAPVFKEAITKMTITDALGVLQGGDTAATHYLREKTTEGLTTAFKPECEKVIQQVGVTSQYKELAAKYNSVMGDAAVAAAVAVAGLDLPKKLETDLPDYVTRRAIHGMYVLMRGEEQKIRENPKAYASDIIQKVFGSEEAKVKKN